MSARALSAPRRPRLGFLGTGWIGRLRLEALADSGAAEIAALADFNPQPLAAAAEKVPTAECRTTLEELLALDLDGVVIATPSALHAEQAVAALDRGVAVFCQKPLARTAAETARVVAAARAADRLLAVDFSYRLVAGMSRLRELIQSGELGLVYAADLTFHNAYGPDKPWFYDIQCSGGGCVMDLGSHLVDLGLWCLGFPEVAKVSSRLYRQGRLLPKPVAQVEDYAVARIELNNGAHLRLACSWCLAAGRDAVIEAAFYGTQGGAALRNQAGSFYDFTVERFRGTASERLAGYPDAWGGRALIDWAQRLGRGEGFDPAAEELFEVARVLDRVYGR